MLFGLLAFLVLLVFLLALPLRFLVLLICQIKVIFVKQSNFFWLFSAVALQHRIRDFSLTRFLRFVGIVVPAALLLSPLLRGRRGLPHHATLLHLLVPKWMVDHLTYANFSSQVISL